MSEEHKKEKKSHPDEPRYTPAEAQFYASSLYRAPPGYKEWKIRVDYPPGYEATRQSDKEPFDAPWLKIPLTDPELYCAVAREYCFEGMIDNDFVPQDNPIREWFHAPWMHYGDAGREPIHGLTSERYCPPRELSATQHRTTQSWAIGFFNSAGASVFGDMWKDPNNPNWKENKSFPPGTAIFKLLYTNATDDEIPFLNGAPEVDALIAVQPKDVKVAPDPKTRDLENPQKLRLLQMDIAFVDPRSETGWVWGTFMYCNLSGKKGYDAMIPVGLSWGSDPQITQEAYDRGERPKQVWFNPAATAARQSLHGGRPEWGWNGRLNGPADNFISACQSCHSTAQWNHRTMSQGVKAVPPGPVVNAFGQFVPNNDQITMSWFSNVPCSTPITKDGAVSADYSMQLMIGYENYVSWEATQKKTPLGQRPPASRAPAHRRQGPDMGF